MSQMIDFGIEDSSVVKSSDAELFKQNRDGDKNRISIVAFKRHHDAALSKKTKEKGAPLTDQERAEIITKVDARLAEHIKKDVKDLTEIDRLDLKNPKFGVTNTHYNDKVGTIRCLSKYDGNTVTEREMCCDKFGDAEQTVGTVIVQYPTDDHLAVEAEIFKQKKMTKFLIWKMGSKKYKKVQSTYFESREASQPYIDLKIVLGGDPKYQKQDISAQQGPAYWVRENVDPQVRAWVLDQGLRMFKNVEGKLGFNMSREKLLERLGESGPAAAGALTGGDSALPKGVDSYDDLLS